MMRYLNLMDLGFDPRFQSFNFYIIIIINSAFKLFINDSSGSYYCSESGLRLN